MSQIRSDLGLVCQICGGSEFEVEGRIATCTECCADIEFCGDGSLVSWGDPSEFELNIA